MLAILAVLLSVLWWAGHQPSALAGGLPGQSGNTGHGVDQQGIEEELLFTTPDYLRKYGYPSETHQVTTDDGYVLTLHRIPGSPRAARAHSQGAKTPVFLQHGIGVTSDSWLLNGPERGLGFLLADQGYDVWLGNVRGNRYCREHVTLSPKSIEFYNFTWHEMGVLDLPAMVHHVLQVTGVPHLPLVCHSMGCTMLFAMTSARSELNHRLRAVVALAPAVHLGGLRSLIRLLVPFRDIMQEGYWRVSEGQVKLARVPATRLIQALCSKGKATQQLCVTIYFSILGFNKKELNETLLPSIIAHAMSGYTINVLQHFGQIISSNRFEMYSRKGRLMGHQTEYDLSRVTIPVAIFYSKGDYVVNYQGVIKLSQKLPNLIRFEQHPNLNWNHMDYVWGIHAKETVYTELMKLLDSYTYIKK